MVDDDQELEALETISLTDFPLTEDGDSCFKDRPNPSATEDLFEFFNGNSDLMSHAEDMIIGGKLMPINNQTHHEPEPEPEPEPMKNLKKPSHKKRSESMHELKSNTNKAAVRQLVRNSHSLDYKKLQRNARMNYEPTANSLSNKSCSSRWRDLMIGPVKVPQEMDLRDIRNRQNNVQNTSKSLFPISVEDSDRFRVSRPPVSDHRKTTSWGVLGILSCKSSGSVAVTMPLS